MPRSQCTLVYAVCDRGIDVAYNVPVLVCVTLQGL